MHPCFLSHRRNSDTFNHNSFGVWPTPFYRPFRVSPISVNGKKLPQDDYRVNTCVGPFAWRSARVWKLRPPPMHLGHIEERNVDRT